MNPDDATLGPMLAHLHRHMRRELGTALLAACGPSAGVWDRWGAVRLLDTELRPCLRAERELVDGVIESVPLASAEHLWTLGELLEALGRRLCELGRLAQGGADFVRAAEKYRLAFEYWCWGVEGSVGPVDYDAAPADVLDRLEALAPHTAVV
jgi:hypothetical protein